MADRGGRGLIATIFKNFWQSLQPRQFSGNKIGTDYFGNTYFEIPLDHNRRRRERWFTPKDRNAFDQEIPPEWEAWLRGRRVDPPSDEELQKNLKLMQIKKENYAKLESEYASVNPPQIADQNVTGYRSFPKYDEYEKSPGEHLDKKKKDNTYNLKT